MTDGLPNTNESLLIAQHWCQNRGGRVVAWCPTR
jgi:hypothetical protein